MPVSMSMTVQIPAHSRRAPPEGGMSLVSAQGTDIMLSYITVSDRSQLVVGMGKLTITTRPNILHPIRIPLLPFNNRAQVLRAIAHDAGVVDSATLHSVSVAHVRAAGAVAHSAVRAWSC